MKILFDLNHPSHVHAFKNVIGILDEKGHTCLVTARRKDCTHALLKAYSIPFTSTGCSGKSLLYKVFQLSKSLLYLIRFIIKEKPDLIVSFESPYAVLAGRLCRKKTITFADTEPANTIHRITGPLSSALAVPSCFQKKIFPAQVSFNGYKELAYLHPARFLPDLKLVETNGLDSSQPYGIIRFVAFNALHDRDITGFTDSEKLELIERLSEKVRVYISSESPLPEKLLPYRLIIPPEHMHHVLAFTSLYIGESTTMSAEAAVLGIPSICVNHMNLGYLNDLSKNYGLIYKYDLSSKGRRAAIEKALEIVGNPDIKKEFLSKRETMLRDKIDVTDYMVWFIENYPDSMHEVYNN